MPDEISDMRLFARMVDAGSLSAAARKFESSPAAMSRRLSALENRLGVRLVTRTSRRFQLTADGERFHERVLPILQAIDEAETEASSRASTPRGLLCIGAPMELGRRQIAPLISAFADKYPTLEIRLTLSDVGLDVIDEGLDVALRIGLPLDTGVIAKRIFASKRVVCASPAYIASHGAPQTPEDLKQHDCLRLLRGRRVFDKWRFAINGEQLDVQVNGSQATGSGEVLHDWALQGRGLALKAHWDIKEDLDTGRLVECLQAYQCDSIDLYAVFPHRRHLSFRVRAFLDFIEAAFKQPSGSISNRRNA